MMNKNLLQVQLPFSEFRWDMPVSESSQIIASSDSRRQQTHTRAKNQELLLCDNLIVWFHLWAQQQHTNMTLLVLSQGSAGSSSSLLNQGVVKSDLVL